MYQVLTPIAIFNYGREFDKDYALREMYRTRTDRVIMNAPDIFDTENIDGKMSKLAEVRLFFERNGFKTGVWIGQTIGHGGFNRIRLPLTNIVTMDGRVGENTYCPLDTDFTDRVCSFTKMVALTGTKFIMIDDDYRLTRASIGCFCEKHIEKYCNIIGEKMTRTEIAAKVFTGPPGRYRDEWLKLSGGTLAGLASKMREAVDEIDEDIRMGLCACFSTWDIDGIDSYELARIMAGRTKPFLRLIGAPYWVNGMWKFFMNNRLANVIELERLECSWTPGDIEIFSEGDTYPRPRYHIPASYLEGFDTALRADGSLDGILKYMYDYTANFDYETKYADLTEKNQSLYAGIDRIFTGLEAVGVNVARKMKNLPYADLPENVDTEYITNHFFYSASLRFLTDNSIPVTYNNDGCPSIIFGQEAKTTDSGLPQNGIILDATAAAIFNERGIDVGIDGIENILGIKYEYYIDENRYIKANGKYYNMKIKEAAKARVKTLSELISAGGRFTGVFQYENKDGLRFLIYPFDAFENRYAINVFRCYCRQRQLARSLPWLYGKSFDALCLGHPDLYMIVKKGENRLSIGLWNFFDDSIEKPEIVLGESYDIVELINTDCGYEIKGNKLTLDCSIIPYGFVGISLRKGRD